MSDSQQASRIRAGPPQLPCDVLEQVLAWVKDRHAATATSAACAHWALRTSRGASLRLDVGREAPFAPWARTLLRL